MTRLAMIFSENSHLKKPIIFHVKSNFLPTISQRILVVLDFPKENTFLYLKMGVGR